MVACKGSSRRYPLERTRAWLGWLARQMRNHKQTVFYVEHLQPDWLDTRHQRIYEWLGTCLPALVIGSLMNTLVFLFFYIYTNENVFTHPIFPSLLENGVLGGFLGWLWRRSVSERGSQEMHHLWGNRLAKRLALRACIGLIYGLSFGFYLDIGYTLRQWQTDGPSYALMIGLSGFLLQYLLRTPVPSNTSLGSNGKRRIRFRYLVQGPSALLVAVIFGLGFGLSDILSSFWYGSGMTEGLVLGLSNVLENGLSLGLSYALISLILGTQVRDIHLTERVKWTWRGLFNFRLLRTIVLLTCISMVFVGLSFGLSFGWSTAIGNGVDFNLNNGINAGLNTGMNAGIQAGLGLGLSYWLLFGLSQGTAQEHIEDQDRRVVNQGMVQTSLTV